MDTPLLSVIIPVYNGEKYIDNIIKNFREQTEKCFELIFIDDGSTDASYEKLSSYIGKEDFEMSVFQQENAGVSAARNSGISKASGSYISFVDCDDYVTADYVEMLKNTIAKQKFDVMVFQTLRVKENSPYVSENSDRTVKMIDKIDMLKRMVPNPTALGMDNLFITRELIEKYDFKFSVGYKYYEDYDLLYRIFAISENIAITEYQMYFYIMRENSAMARFNIDRLKCLSLMENLKPYFEKNAPEFSKTFEKWGISRLYWSIMWQASLAFSLKNARKFARNAYVRGQLKKLNDIPDKKVKLSAMLFGFSPGLFICFAKILGKSHSKVEPVSYETFEKYFNSLPEKVLVYGMTDNRGGIEAYLMNMYHAINREKINFDFVVDWDTMAYSDEAISGRSKIFYIPAKSKNPLKQIVEFSKILREHPEYKTVYFNILNAGSAFNMIAPFIKRRRIVVHSHNGSDDNMKLHKLFMKPLKIFADKKFACSELAARYMFGDKAVDNGKVTLINNAIFLPDYTFNSEIRDEKRRELGLKNELVVFHAGRMSNQKNPLYLLEIFSEIIKLKPDSVLLYAGAGPMADEIKSYAQQLKISDNIRFLGMRNDVKELMQASDIFLLPSKYEGLPVVGIEAQASDLQCFFSDKISPDVKITDSVHFISIENEPSEWAKAIVNADISKRTSREKELTAAGYNIEREAKKLTAVLCAESEKNENIE